MIAKSKPPIADLYRTNLKQILSRKHPLYILAGEIDWSVFEKAFGPFYAPDGRPARPIRLLVGLHYLKYAFNESDESVLEHWVENPYWQYFCGYEYFQHECPVDRSNIIRWRQRVGPERMEALLKETIETAKRKGFLKPSDLSRVNVDTTVQEKAVTYPTDAKLCHKAREVLVRQAKKRKIELRQTYVRVSKRALVMQGRYRHAMQGKKATREVRKIKSCLRRVVLDLMDKVHGNDLKMKEFLLRAGQLLTQQKDSKDKLYSFHAPEVECISKGKVHKKYEFGCKVGLVSTSRKNWIVGVQAFPGRPYDGHTLKEALSQTERLTGSPVKNAYVDRGYRGHDYAGPAEIHVAGRHRSRMTRAERRWMKRRSAIEPIIGHTKHDDRMDRNYLVGRHGDKTNAILAAAGYNFRKLMAGVRRLFLRLFYGWFFWLIPAPKDAEAAA